MILSENALYIKYIRLKEAGDLPHEYPYTVPALAGFSGLRFRRPVTFIVGENGMGKSTLLEAIAVKAGFNAEGGSKNFRFATRETHSPLYGNLVLGRGLQPRDGYFLRAESFYNVATEIDQIADGIHRYYGDQVAPQAIARRKLPEPARTQAPRERLYIFDEPEAALSPSRQMYMLCRIKQLVESGSQFIVSTHSPIVMAYPGADIYEIADNGLQLTEPGANAAYLLMKRFCLDHEGMLRQLGFGIPES